MIQTPCAIFAGGKSSRMGKDKALLPFRGYPSLTQYQYDRLSKIFQTVYIVTKDSQKFDFQADFIQDTQTNPPIYAPTAGFDAVFQTLSDEKVFVLSVDAPFIDKTIIETLFAHDSDKYDATIAKTRRGMQPMCGIYHKSLAPKFHEMLQKNSHKLGYLLKNTQSNFVYFEDETPFFNINHPQEYQEALEKI